jgi:DNA-binding NtrC family response regulator
MSNLLVIKGGNIGMRYDLGKVTSIGRAPENTIQILDPNVSRFHCEIVQRGISYYLRDRESKNGVLVNGEEVGEKTLLRNDEIIIGNTVFLFNTDHDLKNTRFSNKRVYFTSPTDETITPIRKGNALAASPAGQRAARASSELLYSLGTLFSFSELPLPEALERVLQTLVSAFSARNGCLMMWDAVSSDFVPLVAVSDRDSFAVSMNVIRLVLEEKRAVLIPAPAIDKQVATTLRLDKPSDEESGANAVALCVPLTKSRAHLKEPGKASKSGPITGLLYLEIQDGDNLLLQDVQLLQSVANLTEVAIEHYEALDTVHREKGPATSEETQELIGKSIAFTKVLGLVAKVAGVDSTVLITGETGTGKEVIAQEIHRQSHRVKYPFLAINCAAIPETLIESELFGHERGAFTGADRMRRGLIENAHGGTLFLDEIGEMALGTQTKLLRFLQERVITRVGGNQPIPVDVRIIAATNIELEKAVQEKRFREDLWFRLNVFEIHLPALRERPDDVHLLCDHFLRRYGQRYNKQVLGLSDGALRLLEMYPWPGNIRELQNAIERAILLSDRPILEADLFALQPVAAQGAAESAVADVGSTTVSAPLTLEEAERRCIVRALEACDWNQVRAARLLNIHRNTLRKKIADLDLHP